MKRISNKALTFVTSLIMLVLAVGITAVCFSDRGDVAVISSGETYSPVYSGNRAGKNVALMFNVYEGAETIDGIIETLKKHSMKATFFIGGCWAENNEETLVKILESGNELGSHGYFHKDHSKLDEKGNRDEMLATEKLIQRVTGEKVSLFAPPSGAYSVTTLKVAENLGYKTIMWTKDTVDWRDKNAKTVYNRATKNIVGGDFVLMHPKEHTLAALDDILTYYEKLGLKASTVTECME